MSRAFRAFTLMELVVAIGAVAIVSVGLAAIFQTIGRTVSGGQRVSALTQYAAVLEGKLRAEFARVTREGFMVIRNSPTMQVDPVSHSVNGQQRVGLTAEDPSPRVRRIDEIMFFTKGEYETAREPFNPELIARGDYSMVYVGHMQRGRIRVDINGEADPRDSQWNWTETNDPFDGNRGGGVLGGFLASGKPGPNTYASDWTLGMRRVIITGNRPNTVDQTRRGWPAGYNGGGVVTPLSESADKKCQFAAQPAVSEIFRTPAQFVRAGGIANPTQFYIRWDLGTPRISSGLVDIATTNMEEIRSVIQSHNKRPNEITQAGDYDPRLGGSGNDPLDGEFDGGPIRGKDAVTRMREWMLDAMPTQSDLSAPLNRSNATMRDPDFARIRYEPAPRDYLDVMQRYQGGNIRNRIQLETRRADQNMMTSAILAPRCTEFLVEFSFGTVDSSGNLNWFGGDVSGSNETNDPRQIDWYGRLNNNNAGYPYKPWQGARSGSLAGEVAAYDIKPFLLYGVDSPNMIKPITAVFGYTDPLWDPPSNDVGKPRTLPWAWPRLVRITVGLVDEREPNREERFQWVFEMPGTPDPS